MKGGANLRYLFGSHHYSEDIDLDLRAGGPWSLEEKVDSVLGSGAMSALLRVGRLEIAEFSKPQQTDTRRWKVGIAAPGHAEPVRTKIEFSGRNGDDRSRLDSLPDRIVAPYALRPPSVQHYVDDAPAEQKAEALADRSETQTRDVFDLDLLFRRRPLPAGSLDAEILTAAAERALELPFAAFRDQVLPFLDPEVVELYATEAAWSRCRPLSPSGWRRPDEGDRRLRGVVAHGPPGHHDPRSGDEVEDRPARGRPATASPGGRRAPPAPAPRTLDLDIPPFAVAPYVTAPFPAYVSFWSALYHHGAIEQIPRQVSVASLDRTRRVDTAVGTFDVHRIAPDLFGGYRGSPQTGYLASPEKALFDTVYIRAAKGGKAFFPELLLPGGFDDEQLDEWTRRIGSPRLRTLVTRRLGEVLRQASREDQPSSAAGGAVGSDPSSPSFSRAM